MLSVAPSGVAMRAGGNCSSGWKVRSRSGRFPLSLDMGRICVDMSLQVESLCCHNCRRKRYAYACWNPLRPLTRYQHWAKVYLPERVPIENEPLARVVSKIPHMVNKFLVAGERAALIAAATWQVPANPHLPVDCTCVAVEVCENIPLSLKNTIAKETQSRTSKRQRGKLEHNMAMTRKSCDEKMGMQHKATKGGKLEHKIVTQSCEQDMQPQSNTRKRARTIYPCRWVGRKRVARLTHRGYKKTGAHNRTKKGSEKRSLLGSSCKTRSVSAMRHCSKERYLHRTINTNCGKCCVSSTPNDENVTKQVHMKVCCMTPFSSSSFSSPSSSSSSSFSSSSSSSFSSSSACSPSSIASFPITLNTPSSPVCIVCLRHLADYLRLAFQETCSAKCSSRRSTSSKSSHEAMATDRKKCMVVMPDSMQEDLPVRFQGGGFDLQCCVCLAYKDAYVPKQWSDEYATHCCTCGRGACNKHGSWEVSQFHCVLCRGNDAPLLYGIKDTFAVRCLNKAFQKQKLLHKNEEAFHDFTLMLCAERKNHQTEVADNVEEFSDAQPLEPQAQY